jgi:hypothetical protein
MIGQVIGMILLQSTAVLRFLSFLPLAPELTISFCSTAPTLLPYCRALAAYAHICTWFPYSYVVRGYLSAVCAMLVVCAMLIIQVLTHCEYYTNEGIRKGHRRGCREPTSAHITGV